MITDQMIQKAIKINEKARSNNFWENQLFDMQLGVMVSHSGRRLSVELEPDKVYYISNNGCKVHVFSKDILDEEYDKGRKYLYKLGYKQIMKGDK